MSTTLDRAWHHGSWATSSRNKYLEANNTSSLYVQQEEEEGEVEMKTKRASFMGKSQVNQEGRKGEEEHNSSSSSSPHSLSMFERNQGTGSGYMATVVVAGMEMYRKQEY